MAELRERLLRLSEAGLRINESIDFDSVLQKVVDSTRALTPRSYGIHPFVLATLPQGNPSGLAQAEGSRSGAAPCERKGLLSFRPLDVIHSLQQCNGSP